MNPTKCVWLALPAASAVLWRWLSACFRRADGGLERWTRVGARPQPLARGQPEAPPSKRRVGMLTEWESEWLYYVYISWHSFIKHWEALFTYLLGFPDGIPRLSVWPLLRACTWWAWRTTRSSTFPPGKPPRLPRETLRQRASGAEVCTSLRECVNLPLHCSKCPGMSRDSSSSFSPTNGHGTAPLPGRWPLQVWRPCSKEPRRIADARGPEVTWSDWVHRVAAEQLPRPSACCLGKDPGPTSSSDPRVRFNEKPRCAGVFLRSWNPKGEIPHPLF